MIRSACGTATILLATLCSASAAEPEKYALLVGVTTYRHAEMNRTQLKYPEADAKALAEVFQKAGYQVRTLLGDAASKAAVETELKSVAESGNAEGVALVGLFGHGVQYGEDAYFGPYDTRLRAVVDSAGQAVRERNGLPKLEPDPDSMVDMKRILDALATSGAGNRILLADCCREDPSQARGRAFGSKLRVADLPSGTAALFACSEGERAFEHDSWGHGAFTQALLSRVASAKPGERLTANALSVELHDSVDSMVQEKTDRRERQRVNPILNGIVDLKLSQEFVNSIGMRMRFVPAGEFQMGSSPEDDDKILKLGSVEGTDRALILSQERPLHRVKITKAFYLSTLETTKSQFAQFVADTGYETDAEKDELGGSHLINPADAGEEDSDGYDPAFSWRHIGHVYGERHPVVNVSWNDVNEFCKWLSREERRAYRLPTEAEWEYACRAGSDALFSFGDEPEELAKHANVADRSIGFLERINGTPFGSIAASDGVTGLAEVGKYLPNAFGIHDMEGNVMEWCLDGSEADAYANLPEEDPRGLDDAEHCIVRGGSFMSGPFNCRPARRLAQPVEFRVFLLGFRVVCEATP